MKVEIKRNVYLESDKDQYIIKKYTGKQDEKGNELFTVIGYYGNLPSSVKKIFKLKLNESTASTLKELVSEVKKQNEYIETLFTEGGK